MKSIFILGFLPLWLAAQTTPLSGIINRYTAVSGIDSCLGRLSVSDTAGFRVGDAVLIFQMQGAAINTANNSGFGAIVSLNGAGRFEQNRIIGRAANALFFEKRFLFPYDPAAKVQVVSFPHFQNAVVSDTLKAQKWNGQTGGIIALEVEGTLTLDAPVSANGAGFRGGAPYVDDDNNCNWLVPINGYVYNLNNWRAGPKGEGIALGVVNSESGRGPLANGGGGGNDHNSGGGGGGHFGKGGQGGSNDEPSAFGCDGYFPGLGGNSLSLGSGQLVFGGGGGSGHANNIALNAGGNGGGIILIKAGVISGSSLVIAANGLNGQTSNGDGGGGGGAGGSVWVHLGSAVPNLQVSVQGGRGGSTLNSNNNRCFGPGGGGGGGRIFSNVPVTANLAGGNPGLITGSSNGCNNTSSGAQMGQIGAFTNFLNDIPAGNGLPGPISFLQQPQNIAVCLGDSAVLSAQTSNPTGLNFQWEINSGNGWQAVSGPVFSGINSEKLLIFPASSNLNGAMFRVVATRIGCFQTTSQPATLSVLPNPAASFSAALDGQTIQFTNASANASGYFWDFGDGSSSSETNPSHLFNTDGQYSVTLLAWNDCDTVSSTQVFEIQTAPLAVIEAPDTAIGCGTATVQFWSFSSGNITSLNWSFPGGSPPSSTSINPTVTYADPGNYTAQLIVQNQAGQSIAEKVVAIVLFELPGADFQYVVSPNGMVDFENLSANGSSFVWDFGDGSPISTEEHPIHQFSASGSYTVTLVVQNPCGSTVLQKTINILISGVSDYQLKNSIAVFPNPANESVCVKFENLGELPVSLSLISINGSEVWKKSSSMTEDEIVLVSGLPAGIYQLLVEFSNGKASRAVVIQH